MGSEQNGLLRFLIDFLLLTQKPEVDLVTGVVETWLKSLILEQVMSINVAAIVEGNSFAGNLLNAAISSLAPNPRHLLSATNRKTPSAMHFKR